MNFLSNFTYPIMNINKGVDYICVIMKIKIIHATTAYKKY